MCFGGGTTCTGENSSDACGKLPLLSNCPRAIRRASASFVCPGTRCSSTPLLLLQPTGDAYDLPAELWYDDSIDVNVAVPGVPELLDFCAFSGTLARLSFTLCCLLVAVISVSTPPGLPAQIFSLSVSSALCRCTRAVLVLPTPT